MGYSEADGGLPGISTLLRNQAYGDSPMRPIRKLGV
jgi:hypothetical protein